MVKRDDLSYMPVMSTLIVHSHMGPTFNVDSKRRFRREVSKANILLGDLPFLFEKSYERTKISRFCRESNPGSLI